MGARGAGGQQPLPPPPPQGAMAPPMMVAPPGLPPGPVPVMTKAVPPPRQFSETQGIAPNGSDPTSMPAVFDPFAPPEVPEGPSFSKMPPPPAPDNLNVSKAANFVGTFPSGFLSKQLAPDSNDLT